MISRDRRCSSASRVSLSNCSRRCLSPIWFCSVRSASAVSMSCVVLSFSCSAAISFAICCSCASRSLLGLLELREAGLAGLRLADHELQVDERELRFGRKHRGRRLGGRGCGWRLTGGGVV